MNLSRSAVTVMLLLVAAHCWGGQDSMLDLRYEYEEVSDNKNVKAPNLASAPASASVSPASNCAVVIKAPNDLRRNKETLGTNFGDNSIISKLPVEGWLQDALLSMNKLGLNTSRGNAEGSSPVPNVTYLSTDLDRVYVWFHSVNMHATLVVKARMQTGSGPEVQHNYRIISNKSNWAGGDSEFVTTLNIAATRLLEQIAGDINKQCRA